VGNALGIEEENGIIHLVDHRSLERKVRKERRKEGRK
jgi:hypothetical protein